MNQKKLDKSLVNVVKNSINEVGVNLNTVSTVLLKHVSGVSFSVAKNIVIYREEEVFKSKKELLKVLKS